MAAMAEKRKPTVLLALTGSVASIKAEQLLDNLQTFAEVQIVHTKCAQYFFDLKKLKQRVKVYGDEDEYEMWKKIGDPVLHIELRKWADLLLVAPLSANTLAKLANGICDNLLTSVARAWDMRKPIVVCPAMNTNMWEHPFTQKHLAVLEQLGCTVVQPVAKKLACGDTGLGVMADEGSISEAARGALFGRQSSRQRRSKL